MEYQMVKNSFIIASYILTIKYLAQSCPTGGPRAGWGPPAYIYVALRNKTHKIIFSPYIN